MQTKCPHCKTRFRITETQVSAAKGFVRCGICKEVFNAYEVANNTPAINKPLPASPHNKALADMDISTEQATPVDSEETNTEIQQNTATPDFDDAAAPEKNRKDTFDFFDENDNASLQHVVPEHFREPAAQAHSMMSGLLWSIGILLLTASLFFEYVWFNQNKFSHIPELQALLDKICSNIECKNISLRDASKIELLTRNVYTHPNKKEALMISVTMKNNAKFAQPYPIMQIDFSNIRGRTVAARRFHPMEYLDIAAQPPQLLPPDTSSTVTLEIRDPGKQAMTYEFNFL